MKVFFHKHCHWMIALAMFLQMGIFYGMVNNNGLFLLPVSEALGISRSEYSLAMIPLNLCAFFMVMLSGPLYLRLGYGKMTALALPLVAAGFLVLSVSRGIGGLLLGATLVGISTGFCGISVINRVIDSWFSRHRGLVWGAVASATGVGGSLCCVALSKVMEQNGWRGAYLLAMILVSLLLLINLCFVRGKPEQLGVVPYGAGAPMKQSSQPTAGAFQGYVFSTLLRKPFFYGVVVAQTLTFFCLCLPPMILVAHMRDCGLTEAQAVGVQSTYMLALAVAKIICGWLTDAIGIRKTMLLCLVCGAVSTWLLSDVTGVVGAVAVVIIFALSAPITTVTVPALTMELFGYHSYITAVGVFTSIAYIGNTLGGPIANMIFDAFGSYRDAFRACGFILAAMVVGYLILYRVADVERIRWLRENPGQPVETK